MTENVEFPKGAESRIEDLAEKLGIEPAECAEHFATGVLRAGESVALCQLRLDIRANRSPETIERLWAYIAKLSVRSTGKPDVVSEIRAALSFADELGGAR